MSGSSGDDPTPLARVSTVASPECVDSPTRTDRRRAETRARLIDAGFRVLAEKGPEATIQEITDAADVGFGTFYVHFDSKEAMLDALTAEIGERVVAPVATAVDAIDDPAMRLAAWTRLLLDRFHDRSGSDRFLIDAIGQSMALRAELNRWLVSTLSDGVELGRFPADVLPIGPVVLGGAFRAYLRAERELGVDLEPGDLVVSVLRAVGVADTEARRIAASPMPQAV